MDKSQMIAKAQSLIEGVNDLPTIPEIATKVLSLLNSPDVDVDEVADLILSDQVMAARVLKIVNSPLYRPAQEITSLKKALIYLGLRQIRELALTCSFIEAFEERDGAFTIRTFWEHSFGVGVVSRIIAGMVGYRDVEKAYIAGVIHDIGEVFVSHYLKEDFLELLAQREGQPRKLVEIEERAFGTTHCELGLCIARRWNFPEDYCEVIACHHEPESAVLDPVLTAIVALADLFCLVRQLDYNGSEWVSFDLSEEQAWQILRDAAPGLEDFDAEKFCYQLDDRVEEIRELVRTLFNE